MKESNKTELVRLALLQCDGRATQADFLRLEQLMQHDAAARKIYLKVCFLHADLVFSEGMLSAAAIPLASPQTVCGLPEKEPAVVRAAILAKWLAPALALSLCLLAAAFFIPPRLLQVQPLPPLVAQQNDHYPTKHSVPPQHVARLKTIQSQKLAWLQGSKPVQPGEALAPGTLRLEQGTAQLAFDGGADVELSGPSIMGVESNARAALFSGKLSARITEPGVNFTVDTPGLRIVDLGTEFGVHVDPRGYTEVHVFEGEVETLSRVRLPIMYWPFDDVPYLEQVTGQSAQPGPDVVHAAGLVGSGAVSFSNTEKSYVDLGNGGGKAAGSGKFSVTTGISVEAIIASRWQGHLQSGTKRPFDYDEIFRKEDGHYRILLSFQHDDGAGQPVYPPVARGPCLSFGLHLAGQGYQELDMPLDGHDGRPTVEELCDGKPHHVVAAYDSYSGIKAIYIDGVLRHQALYEPGTLIVSGGGQSACIGNISPVSYTREPFTGEIDEVAFYDFALTAEEIAAHWLNAKQGNNYFGVADQSQAPAGWQPVNRLQEGQAMRFDTASGLPLGTRPLSRALFGKQ